MNTTTVNVTAAVAAGLTAAMFGFAAPAVAAPMPGGDAAETITMLEAEGNRVIVNRLSDTPLDQAEVVSIYRGPALRDTVEARFAVRAALASAQVKVRPDHRRILALR